MDYLDFKSWKNSHCIEMRALEFSRADSIFIFTRFAMRSPISVEGRQLVFAESIEEAIGYIRHIFLFDILTDSIDDLQFDYKSAARQRQFDSVKLFYFWYRFARIAPGGNTLQELCNEFNGAFAESQDLKYEIKVIFGIDELYEFIKN